MCSTTVPGSTEVSLRGLGANRTLILVNGRRLSPDGHRGRTGQPRRRHYSRNLGRTQYDLLLDGASSVYGSDAIGGVANVILRKDFEGFEIDVTPANSPSTTRAS